MSRSAVVITFVVLLLLSVIALFLDEETGLSGLAGKNPGYQWKKVMSGKEVWKQLEKNGWEFARWKGSHKIYKKNNETISVPAHKMLKIGTLNSIKKFITFVENK